MNFDFVPVLSSGSHDSPEKGACIMEMVSFMSGNEWSDTPDCSGALITYVAQKVNDNLSNKDRGMIMQHFHRLFGTADSSQHPEFLAEVRDYADEEARMLFFAAHLGHSKEWWGSEDDRESALIVARTELARLQLIGTLTQGLAYGEPVVQYELIFSIKKVLDYIPPKDGVRILGDILDIYDRVFGRTNVPVQDISKLAALPGQVTV